MTDKPLPLINNPHTPEIYADNCLHVSAFPENMKLTFQTLGHDGSADPAPARIVVGRLVMPRAAAIQMAKHILHIAGSEELSKADALTDTVQ